MSYRYGAPILDVSRSHTTIFVTYAEYLHGNFFLQK